MIVVSHPFGNANVRAALSGFQQSDLIARFITTVASFPGNKFDKLSAIPGFASFSRRQFDSSLRNITSFYPCKEIVRLMAMQINIEFLIAHSRGPFSTDKVIQHIDHKVADYILQNKHDQLKAVYAYEDGAIRSFEAADKKGLRKLYDLPIGYWRVARDIFENERQRWPQWACTIPAFKDPEDKFIRKDKELLSADVIYAAGSYTASTLKVSGLQYKKVKIIPYGFPSVNESPRKWFKRDEKLKLLYVGSLTQRKGVADVLDLAKKFQESVSLTLVGKKTTNDCRPLNEAINKYQYFPSLPHHEILRLMRTHDVLVFPSLFEGFGLVITEAMSQGMPVITTERTCGADLIRTGYNGWLTEAGNTDMLCNIIQGILDHPESVEENGMNALLTAQKRPWHVYGNELADSVAYDINIIHSD